MFRKQIGGARRQGFSLLEVMVVLVIIAMIAGMVAVSVRGKMVSARQNVAKAEIATLVQAVEQYFLQTGRYPTNDQGLEVLAQPLESTGDSLIKRVPVDPWGEPYKYSNPGPNNEPFEIISYGADGTPGGDGGNQDIVSSELGERPSQNA